MDDPSKNRRISQDDFDALVDSLQEKIDEDARARFPQQVIDEFHEPKNWGRMEDHHGKGVFSGGCGDTMEFFLKIEDHKIVQASFWTDGCGPTVACGSRLTTMIKGATIEKAREISPDDLSSSLGDLPEENYHCSELTIEAFKIALIEATGSE